MPIRIVYASQVCSHVGHSEIDAVVKLADDFNRQHGITGVLAFDGFQVIQVLEGPKELVESLYGRILEDTRHEGIVTLRHEAIETALFPDWCMIRRSTAEVLLLIADLP